MNLSDLSEDRTWTLFLDRDGVINRRIPDGYVRTWNEFKFLPGVLDAIPLLNNSFDKIIIVSNQQGVGKKLMTEAEVDAIHARMLDEISKAGGRIDKVYYSPYLASENHPSRKPGPGMAHLARQDFPGIEFTRSVMVGDTYTDLLFGKNLGMVTVFLSQDFEEYLSVRPYTDFYFEDLLSFAKELVTL